MLERISDAIYLPWLADLATEHSMLQPVCETLHFLGLALLVGTVGTLDLRLLGLAKSVPPAALHRLVPWGIGGFATCMVTGLVFVLGDPFLLPISYFRNLSFQLKMLLVALAGLNVVAFYATGLGRKIAMLGAGADAPRAAKVIAATSLLLWVGVMYFGRMMPWADALHMLFEEPPG
ncbi:MAG TPA: hypothetical protein VMV46_00900 [Thermoanaerobaculia bacterium]|nr:hypothetical protein [Thermoanaerobaculia bacterium]